MSKVRFGCRAVQKACTICALTLLCLSASAAVAGAQDCMAAYYREKSPACIDEILAHLRQTRGDPSTIIGFLAQLFRISPQVRERVLSTETSDYLKSVELISLYRAGLSDQAQKFAATNNLSSLTEKMRANKVEALDAVRPFSTPADNDLLIGAYMASGDAALIARILENYSTADDGMIHDAIRIGFMMSKFGTRLAPNGRDSATLQVACERYQCKADRNKFLRVMTLATATWSLRSLSEKDEGIKKTLSDFFEHDVRLKTIFTIEQVAFGNYLTALIGIEAFKDAAMSKSASIYESLGDANEAFAPPVGSKK